MRLTISAAARLFGIHRSTLHRHINAGRLSCVFEPDGSRALDLSELIRCYGEPPNAPEPVRQDATPDATGGDTADATGATGVATPADNALLLEELRRQTTVIERMAERIERLEEAMRRLPPPGPGDAPAPATATPTPPEEEGAQGADPERQPPRDFADLAARFEARTKH